MKLNFGFLKCFGFCLVFCSALCLLQVFVPGGSTQKAKIKDDNSMIQTITDNETPFACNMTALNPEEKKRVLDLLNELKVKHQEVKELSNGYAFRYAMDSETFRHAAEFIIYERLCCPFFEFDLKVEKENGAMWLQLTGRPGIKNFIKIEFGI